MIETVALAGSYRAAPEGAVEVGAVEPDERIAVTVHLKRRTPDRFAPGSAGASRGCRSRRRAARLPQSVAAPTRAPLRGSASWRRPIASRSAASISPRAPSRSRPQRSGCHDSSA
jgi:hypothetical protein